MFSRCLLTCRVSPSDRSQPVHPAWTEGTGCCCSCQQLRVLEKQSGVEPQDKEDVFASTSPFSSPTLLKSPLSFLSCGLPACGSLTCVSQQHRCSSSTLCAVLSSPFCKRYSSCPFLRAGSLESPERSSRAWLCPDSSLGLLESCKKDLPECSCPQDLSSSGCSLSCSDSALLSTSLSSLSLRSLTSPCESGQEVVLQSVQTSAAFSGTTNTITTTYAAKNQGKCSLVCSLLGCKGTAVVSDSQSYSGVDRCLGRGRRYSRSTATSAYGSVSQRASVPHGGQLNQDRFGVDFSVHVSPVSSHCGSLSSPRTDSDSDAQIDSMSSSDLDHCEDLQTFELAHQLPDLQPYYVCDGQRQTGAPKERPSITSVDPALKGLDRHIMSYQEFEQLPPLAEDCGELPALWEDGGALRVGGSRDGFSFGRSVGREEEEQWSTESSVQISTDHADGNSDVHDADDNHRTSLEQRSTLIEQTLSEIYESPFQQLIYASSQSSTKHDSRSQRKISFKAPNSRSSNPNPTASHSDNVDGNKNIVDDNEDNEKDDGETLSDEVGNAEEIKTVRSDRDTHVSMKASIARAAQKAVHGYRTCDDADSYVGTRIKPTLILARAPPSPSGILRRSNKKAAAKVPHGTVRWADGRPPSLPPTDDAT